MKRTSKKERKENAIRFWNSFKNGADKAAIVVQRNDSTTNPYVNRTMFLTICPSDRDLPFNVSPIIIAESNTHGIEGCFMELLQNIKSIPQTTYFEDGFNGFLEKEYGFKISYNDGFVIMIEKIG